MRIARPTYLRSGRLPSLAVALAAAAAAVLAGCGGSGGKHGAHGALTIYASLPRHGLPSLTASAVAAGAHLALADAGGRAGGRRVRLVPLDSTAPGADTWDPGTVEANARRASDDQSAVAYLGELDTGGSAISIPVTSSTGLLQLSPLDGLSVLTHPDPTNPAEGPARYYSNGRRTFLRLVPPDFLQADALVRWARDAGARSIAIVRDDRLSGRALARETGDAAARLRIPVTDIEEARHGAPDYTSLAHDLAAKPAEAVIYTGLGGVSADRLLAAVSRALPHAAVYAGVGIDSGGAVPSVKPVDALERVGPESVYGAVARSVLRRLRAERGGASVPVQALYGYEAMRLILEAIDAAGNHGGERAAVLRAALRPRVRRSPLGTYSITASGDAAPARFASYRLFAGSGQYLGLRGPSGPLSRGLASRRRR